MDAKDRDQQYRGKQPLDSNGFPIQCLRPEDGKVWNLDGSGPSSVQSVSLKGYVIRVVAKDAAGTIAFGSDPTADEDSLYLSAGVPEYFRINYEEKVAIYGTEVNIAIMR